MIYEWNKKSSTRYRCLPSCHPSFCVSCVEIHLQSLSLNYWKAQFSASRLGVSVPCNVYFSGGIHEVTSPIWILHHESIIGGAEMRYSPWQIRVLIFIRGDPFFNSKRFWFFCLRFFYGHPAAQSTSSWVTRSGWLQLSRITTSWPWSTSAYLDLRRDLAVFVLSRHSRQSDWGGIGACVCHSCLQPSLCSLIT